MAIQGHSRSLISIAIRNRMPISDLS